MKQLTIKRKIEGVGIGLHSGEPIRFSLHPLEPDSGIVFFETRTKTYIEALPQNVINTTMATVIGKDNVKISTIEHLLSAIYAFGIDNLLIKIDAQEVPIMDGSSASFCMMLNEVGITKQKKNKKIMIISKDIEINDGNKFVKISPSLNSEFIFSVDFKHPAIGFQQYHFHFNKQNYTQQISRARTFGFLKDVQMLREQNLALGASLDNAIVLDDKKIINEDGLRFGDEFVRHKILDAIGDLTLLGMPYIGKYESFAGSHQLNHLLTQEILKSSDNYKIKELESKIDSTFSKVYA